MNTPRPYIDQRIPELQNEWIREFDLNGDPSEFVWHRDKKDRKVFILEGNGWFFQMDDRIPCEMKKGDVLEVPKETYHRIFKAGSNPLRVRISESE